MSGVSHRRARASRTRSAARGEERRAQRGSRGLRRPGANILGCESPADGITSGPQWHFIQPGGDLTITSAPGAARRARVRASALISTAVAAAAAHERRRLASPLLGSKGAPRTPSEGGGMQSGVGHAASRVQFLVRHTVAHHAAAGRRAAPPATAARGLGAAVGGCAHAPARGPRSARPWLTRRLDRAALQTDWVAVDERGLHGCLALVLTHHQNAGVGRIDASMPPTKL